MAGLARYTSLFGCPILPTKFRLVVDMDRSPAARMPIWPPRHGPQVGVLALESANDPLLTVPFPLDPLDAETQGLIGYWLACAVGPILIALGLLRSEILSEPKKRRIIRRIRRIKRPIPANPVQP